MDLLAEYTLRDLVGDAFDACVLWAENVHPETDVSLETRPCLLIDMIDGAHLHQRNFSNWCSAIVAFDARSPELLAAYIVLPSESRFYFAKNDATFTKSINKSNYENRIKQRIENRVESLLDATVCMYAQRSAHILPIIDFGAGTRLMDWLREIDALDSQLRTTRQGKVNFRLYNFGGNPMMARLIDGAVDVVLDLKGQQPQDFVPGALLALRAGATFGSPNGEKITEQALAECLRPPGQRAMPYVLAANERLYYEIVELLTRSS